MLENIRQNGFNPDRRINGGLGGLWINWRYGTRPLEVNFNGTGKPDEPAVDPARHDELTDLRYLRSLLWFKHLHPTEARFDFDIQRFTPIVKKEFTKGRNERGWIYDELIHLWWLSGDNFFRETARRQAETFANKMFRADIGAVYKTSDTSSRGHYRVDLALQIGCALVQAGTQFQNADWTMKGERLVRFVYDHAYLPEYRVFLSQMDEVRLPDGTANPNEKIYRSKFRNYVSNGGTVRFGGMGLEALSLLHAYQVSSNKVYLERALDLLAPLSVEANTLGLWDVKHGGYFGGLEFTGEDFKNPGKPKLLNKTKESGRQFHMLQAFHVANALTSGRFQNSETELRRVALEKGYYAPGHGVLYEVMPDWTPRLHDGQAMDWVTTEAMGCMALALCSGEDQEPW
jgi:hypothetical protein